MKFWRGGHQSRLSRGYPPPDPPHVRTYVVGVGECEMLLLPKSMWCVWIEESRVDVGTFASVPLRTVLFMLSIFKSIGGKALNAKNYTIKLSNTKHFCFDFKKLFPW